jgi:signal transduction histidine kinase
VVLTSLRDHHGEPFGFVKVTRDITDDRRTEQNREFLADATQELASALDPLAALERLVRLAVPRVADLCAVDLAREDGSSGEFVATASVHAAKGRAFADARRLVAVGPAPSSRVLEALQRGDPVFFPEVGERELAAIARSPEHLALVRDVGLASFMAVPLRSRGAVYGALSLAMTEPGRRFDRVHLEVATELARRAELALDNARLFAETQSAVRARDHVLAVVSHDLKSPLTAIQLSAASAARALEKDDATGARRHLDGVQRGTRRAHRLVQDLLDMASIRAGRLSVRPAREDAHALLADAAQAHEALAREKEIALSVEGPADVAVECDRDRVLQVLANVIANAMKFCERGARVALSLERGERDVTFTVRDTGPGVRPELLPHVFDAYWSTARSREEGTGLGLFISKGIVEAHGGRMWIESRLGEGTTVRFTLSRAVA